MEGVLNITELLIHLGVDAILTCKAVLALLVQRLCDAQDLVRDLLLAALLRLVTTFLLACEVLTEVDTSLVDLLDDLSLKLLALLVDLNCHTGLEVLHIVVELRVEDLQLVTLGANVEAKTFNQDVEWLQALVLAALVAHDLLVNGAALELHHGRAGLLLVLEVVMRGLHARCKLVEAGVSRRHGEGCCRDGARHVFNDPPC